MDCRHRTISVSDVHVGDLTEKYEQYRHVREWLLSHAYSDRNISFGTIVTIPLGDLVRVMLKVLEEDNE